MKYALLVLAPPHSGQASLTGARFAQALLAGGHELERVFFLDDGCLNGAENTVYPQDELNPIELWATLNSEHSVELALCIASALKRGVLDDTETQRYERSHNSIHSAFTITGLGQLIDATASADRVVTFAD